MPQSFFQSMSGIARRIQNIDLPAVTAENTGRHSRIGEDGSDSVPVHELNDRRLGFDMEYFLPKEMERRGHKFVRYADDVNVYTRSRRAAQRVLSSRKEYLETKLKLKVNEKKSEAGSPLWNTARGEIPIGDAGQGVRRTY